MKIRAAAFILFICFGLAAIGAAVTTTKYLTTGQLTISGKDHRMARPAG
jgi:hypothetical protein